MYLAGHFSHKALQKKSTQQFTKDRIYRLALLSVAYTILGAPLCVIMVRSWNGKDVSWRWMVEYMRKQRGVCGPVSLRWFGHSRSRGVAKEIPYLTLRNNKVKWDCCTKELLSTTAAPAICVVDALQHWRLPVAYGLSSWNVLESSQPAASICIPVRCSVCLWSQGPSHWRRNTFPLVCFWFGFDQHFPDLCTRPIAKIVALTAWWRWKAAGIAWQQSVKFGETSAMHWAHWSLLGLQRLGHGPFHAFMHMPFQLSWYTCLSWH